jgi:predicted nucleic acid-binding protein
MPGPTSALLNAGDKHHAGTREVWARLEPPVHTCEGVLSEAQHVLRRPGENPRAELEFLRQGVFNVAFSVEDEVGRLLELQRTYADVPMSLAEACLVRGSELHGHSRVLTTDPDFRTYRRNRRQVIPLVASPRL